jgi:hypothetical protein
VKARGAQRSIARSRSYLIFLLRSGTCLESAKAFSSSKKLKQTTDQRAEEVGRLPVFASCERPLTTDGTKETQSVQPLPGRFGIDTEVFRGVSEQSIAALVSFQQNKTYSSRDSHVVTHRSTNLPFNCLCMAERTGCPVFS